MKSAINTVFLILIVALSAGAQTSHPASLKVDAFARLQQIDGIGVNANTRSWNGHQLEPALDLLVDSLHATIWRVIVESVEKWEEVNDNNDPFVMNWDYYNKLYETPKFQKAWAMIRYLNNHGIKDNLIINFMGFAPQWMGQKVIEPRFEDEFVEMLSSFFYYAINTHHLEFGLVAPTNESDHHQYSEGPHLSPEQHARILHKLIERMKQLGILDRIRFIGPDAADTGKAIRDFIPAMMNDSLVMSRLAHFGLHSYGSDYNYEALNTSVKKRFPGSSFWMTEWNQWCNGCDDGILGEYDYRFASASVGNLLQHLKHGAAGAIAWEGYDSYYEHHAPSTFSYWGLLSFDSLTGKYSPRKHFYAIQHVSRFVASGSWLLSTDVSSDSLVALAFQYPLNGQLTLVGINKSHKPMDLAASLTGFPELNQFEWVYTDATNNLKKGPDSRVDGKTVSIALPANCIFTLTGRSVAHVKRINPEPAGWYAGDIHVHRNCGDEKVVPYNKMSQLMEPNDLSVISLLADMGNGEVKDSQEDLKLVNGQDSPLSSPGRIIHWDTEWHWDAVYNQFDHQALGGHLVLLGLNHANQIWEESPHKVLNWAKEQKAVRGFAHFQYLNNEVQSKLDCCIPIDYPVEAALGNIDFISEDVDGRDHAMSAYYRLLNCGFQLGLAAGTDFPCNGYEPLGTLLTYVEVKDSPLTYAKWVEGIGQGRTVISRKGHQEFLSMKINHEFGPGDALNWKKGRKAQLKVTWTGSQEFTGAVELIRNGKVIARKEGTVKPNAPVVLTWTEEVSQSSWICARSVDPNGHRSHTAPVYILIDSKPVRASREDAQYFIDWIDNILENSQPGGIWAKYFSKDLDQIRQHYLDARAIYEKIKRETK